MSEEETFKKLAELPAAEREAELAKLDVGTRIRFYGWMAKYIAEKELAAKKAEVEATITEIEEAVNDFNEWWANISQEYYNKKQNIIGKVRGILDVAKLDPVLYGRLTDALEDIADEKTRDDIISAVGVTRKVERRIREGAKLAEKTAERLEYLKTPRTLKEFQEWTGLKGGAAYAWLSRQVQLGKVQKLKDGRWQAVV
jgi:hypothetical protein